MFGPNFHSKGMTVVILAKTEFKEVLTCPPGYHRVLKKKNRVFVDLVCENAQAPLSCERSSSYVMVVVAKLLDFVWEYLPSVFDHTNSIKLPIKKRLLFSLQFLVRSLFLLI